VIRRPTQLYLRLTDARPAGPPRAQRLPIPVGPGLHRTQLELRCMGRGRCLWRKSTSMPPANYRGCATLPGVAKAQATSNLSTLCLMPLEPVREDEPSLPAGGAWCWRNMDEIGQMGCISWPSSRYRGTPSLHFSRRVGPARASGWWAVTSHPIRGRRPAKYGVAVWRATAYQGCGLSGPPCVAVRNAG
jgi:hypothetical protein